MKLYTSFTSTGLSPDLQTMEQIRRIMRPTDVPDTGKYYLIRVSVPDTGKYYIIRVSANC